MPELPEVEALRLSLWPHIHNQTILKVSVKMPKLVSAKGTTRQPDEAKTAEFVEKIENRTITGLKRRSKNLIFELSDGGIILVHLKMSGQLVYQQNEQIIMNNEKLSSNHSYENSITLQHPCTYPSRQLLGTPCQEEPDELNKTNIPLLRSVATGNGVFETQTIATTPTLVWGGHPIDLSKEKLPGKHTHVILQLENGTLFYNDIRQFGYLLYYPNQQTLNDSKHFDDLGVEPLGQDFTLEYFQTSLKNKTGSLKKIFLDQKVVVGLGNIYTDEVSFLSGVLPNRPISSLKTKEIKLLYENIRAVLTQAVDDGGSSVANYLLGDGTKGNYAKKHYVYNRAGKECKICGHKLQKTTLASRTTVYCPICQK